MPAAVSDPSQFNIPALLEAFFDSPRTAFFS